MNTLSFKSTSKTYLILLCKVGIGLVFALYLAWLFTNSFNMISRDEYRIAGHFLRTYFNSQGFTETFQTFVAPENESRPVVVRILYVLTYLLTGNVNFQLICILGSLILLAYILFLKKILADIGLSIFYFLPIPFLFLNLSPFLTYLFSYEAFFYISSFVIPIFIFYLEIVKCQRRLALLILVISWGIGSTAILATTLLIGYHLIWRHYKESVIYGIALLLMVFSIPEIDPQSSQNPLTQLVFHFGEITVLVFAFCGNVLSVFSESSYPVIILGATLLLFCLVLFFTKINWKNSLHNFITISLIFMLAMITLNIIARWRGDFHGYLSEILQGTKLIFTIGTFSIIYVFILAGLHQYKGFRKIFGVIILLFSVAFYATGNFNNYKNAIAYQKRLHCDIFNWEASKFIAVDGLREYDFLRAKKIFTPSGSFTPAFVSKLKKLSLDTTVRYSVSQFNIQQRTGQTKNMYGIYPKFVTIENALLPLPSKILHSNGHFLILVGKDSMLMITCTIQKLSLRRLLLGQNPYNPGFTAGFSYLDIPAGDYRIALCTVVDQEITEFGYIDKKLHLW